MQDNRGGFKKSTTTTPKPKADTLALLKVDGDFGQISVRMLQRMLNAEINAGLDVDGVLGPLTWKALQNYINKWIAEQNH